MKQSFDKKHLSRISDFVWEIPANYRKDMRVPVRVLASETLLEQVVTDASLWQICNVATLPGIVPYAWVMPDIHEGYGFPIGGVAGMDIDQDGVISPGGIGYDINCGVRLLALSVQKDDVQNALKPFAQGLFNAIPSGVGKGGNHKLSSSQMKKILEGGGRAALLMGFGQKSDLEYCEEGACFSGALAEQVSKRAKERGEFQLGTLGSGNHFVEVQVVDEVFDKVAAAAFGLQKGQLTVMIHCGSRGLGHQVCTDFVAQMLAKQSSYGYQLADRQLACAPIKSEEGQHYLGAMKACANFAFANRQAIAHEVRQVAQTHFGANTTSRLVYDVAHNIGKEEAHLVDGQKRKLLVHRKGATRAFGPKHPEIPSAYAAVGQPVLIPGTMGTASYVLRGTSQGFTQNFGSCAHGAGRAMSRMKAKKTVQGSKLRQELKSRDILVFSNSDRGLAEEAPLAYKDIHDVVNVVHEAQVSERVVRLRPLAVIKGD